MPRFLSAQLSIMKLVIQRVTEANVSINGSIVGKIGKGLMVLVGVATGDTVKEADWLASKTAALRIFDDENGVMNRSVVDIGGDILAISQFTLLADTSRGHRPSYINAAKGNEAEPIYQHYCKSLENILQRKVEKGVFGADMKVSLVNDGPVTIIMKSKTSS